jgi:antitoxin MazE
MDRANHRINSWTIDMGTAVARWGNSLALRIPKDVAERAGLQEGDGVDLTVVNGKLVVNPQVPRYSLEELLDGFDQEKHGHAEVDWGASVGREVS